MHRHPGFTIRVVSEPTALKQNRTTTEYSKRVREECCLELNTVLVFLRVNMVPKHVPGSRTLFFGLMSLYLGDDVFT
jgi:hypothetical protein